MDKQVAPSYFELEQALENAALQVETMSAIIGVFLVEKGKRTLTAEDLRHNHDTFNVVVTPNDNGSITLTLKVKDDPEK